MKPFLAFTALALLIGTPALAREQGSAPDVRVLGFSQDGRYFGYETTGGVPATGAGAYAIDVVDRNTGQSVRGFPRGVTQMSIDAPADDQRQTWMRGLGLDPDKPETFEERRIRRVVMRDVSGPLRRMALRDPGFRVAGHPLTDIDRPGGSLRFITRPDILTHQPATIIVYKLETRLSADPEGLRVLSDPEANCRERETPAQMTLSVDLRPETPAHDPEAASRSPEAFRPQSIRLPIVVPRLQCLAGAVVTDVYVDSQRRTLAALVAILMEDSMTESVEMRAVIYPLR